MIEKYLARHFLRIQHTLDSGDLDNGHWLLGLGNPADGLARAKSEMAPSIRSL